LKNKIKKKHRDTNRNKKNRDRQVMTQLNIVTSATNRNKKKRDEQDMTQLNIVETTKHVGDTTKRWKK